jgi:hypothetical protein
MAALLVAEPTPRSVSGSEPTMASPVAVMTNPAPAASSGIAPRARS